MAEQLRRLYSLAALWDIEIKIVHTPGKDLIQNDAVSRGKDPEPPRQRFVGEGFSRISARWGVFESGIGAEMEQRLSRQRQRKETERKQCGITRHTAAWQPL